MHRFNGVERDAVSGLKEGLTTDYVSGVAYAAHGGMAKMTLGPKVEQWCYNERLQPAVIRVGAAESVNCAAQAGDLLRLAYGYGTGSTNNGNVMSQEIARLGFSATQSYLFDALNRIQNVTEGAEWQTYGYSRHGNWWVEAASANWTPGTFTPRAETWYNAATNQLTSAGLGIAHLDGNLTAIGAYAFSYDAENRMATSTVNSTATVYGYDGEGRRVKKGSTYYVHDAFGQLAAEYGGTVSGAPRQYLTGDHLGSTRLVVDASGVMAQCLDYFPFGELIARSDCGAGSGVTLKFTGKERDGETGWDYFGARYLSGALGRWTIPDSVNVTNERLLHPTNTLNKYVYAGNNPLKFVDPDGRDIIVFYSNSGPAGHWMLAAHNPETNDFAFRSFGPQDHSAGTMARQAAGGRVAGTETYELPKSVDELRQNYAALTIQTSPEQAQAVIESIRSSGSSVYTLYQYNCTTACQKAMREAGIQVTALSPKLAWEFLYADYSREALSRKGSKWYEAWRARLLPSLLPFVSVAPHRQGVDYGRARSNVNTFDLVMKMLLTPLRGCVTVQGPKGPETTCDP